MSSLIKLNFIFRGLLLHRAGQYENPVRGLRAARSETLQTAARQMCYQLPIQVKLGKSCKIVRF